MHHHASWILHHTTCIMHHASYTHIGSRYPKPCWVSTVKRFIQGHQIWYLYYEIVKYYASCIMHYATCIMHSDWIKVHYIQVGSWKLGILNIQRETKFHQYKFMHLVDITSCIIMHHEYRIIRNALCIMHHALSLDQGNLSLVGCLQLKDLN